MVLTMLAIITFLLFVVQIQAQTLCDFPANHPHKGEIVLSNGAKVPYPTHATEVDTYIIFGLMDWGKTKDFLAPQNVEPSKTMNYAVGALSVYDYKQSDVGAFRESYFVILVKPPKGLTPALYHDFAWSSHETPVLMSKEIWNIPSELSSIETQDFEFSVSTKRGPVFEMKWESLPTALNPLTRMISVYAVGPNAESWSPVKACGSSATNRFTEKDSITVVDPVLKERLQHLEFKPYIKEYSKGKRAVQFLPEPAHPKLIQ